MDPKPPARAGYWLMRLQNKLDPEYRALQAKKFEIIQKHGVQADDGSWSVVDPEKIAAFLAEWKPIAEDEIEVSTPTIKIEVFGDTAMDPAHFGPLLPFMED